RNILWGAERFSDIRRGVPMMSPTLLTQRLRRLEAEGIVERRRAGRAVRYRLTEAGREFTDQPAHKALWWFLNENGSCQLCVDDPGGEPVLYLAATVADFIRVYRGDVPLPAALADGRLEAIGDRRARERLAAWLNLSPLAAVRPARAG
ncbi:winged helix-turn-helix transcriptional regulator, partial [Albidovulum sp.]